MALEISNNLTFRGETGVVHFRSCAPISCGALEPCPPVLGFTSDVVATDVAIREVTVHRGIYKYKVLVVEH